MNKNTRSKIIFSLILAFVMLLQFFPAHALASVDAGNELKVAVISDIHVIPPSMWSDNPDSAAAVSADRKMFAESAAIFDAAIAGIIQEAPDVVLIPGDLTKDGEYESHVYVAEKLTELKEALPDVDIYVINGNHDINNPHAYDYSSGAGVPVHSATPEEFREIYNGFGYGGITSEYFIPADGKAGSNSYTARPADGFTVIAIDAAKYSVDATQSNLDRQETGGNISADLMSWVLEKAQQAKERGDTVITFMHHGLVPHFSMEPTLLADFLADNYIEASETMANAGIRYVFTGHMHAQNIASVTTAAGNVLYDIETGSLVTYPSPIRYAVFTKGVDSESNPTEKVDISTKLIKEIDFIDPATGEKITDLTKYGYDNSVDEDTIGGLVTGVVAGGFIDVTGLLGGLLDAELTTTGGQTHTGSRAFFESMLPFEDADGEPISNDFGDFMIGMMREMLPATQADGIDVQGLVRVFYEASNSRIRMAALGGIGNLYITDANMRAQVVNPTFIQLDALLSNEAYVNALFGRVVASIVDMVLYTDENDNEYTFFDFGKYVFLAHLAGDAVSKPWVDAIIAGLFDGAISAEIGDFLNERLLYELSGVFDDIMINTNSLITNDLLGALLKSTFVNAMGGNPAPLGGILDLFGIDFLSLVGGDALGDLLSDEMIGGLGNMVGGLGLSFIEGSGNDIGDNNANLRWVGEGSIIIPDPTDKEELMEVITEAVAKRQSDFTTGSWSAFAAALAEALVAFDSSDATQDQIDEAASNLRAAIAALTPIVPVEPSDGEVYAQIHTAAAATVNSAVEYVVSLSALTKAQVVTVTFVADGTYLDLNSVAALNGFQLFSATGAINGIVWEQLSDGLFQGTVKLLSIDNQNGVTTTDIQNVFTISGAAREISGETIVRLAGIEITRISEDNKAYKFAAQFADPSDRDAKSTITEKQPVYSIYDLNRDGKIGDEDLAIAWYYYLMTSTHRDWEVALYDVASAKDADVTGDDIVNLADLIEILANYCISYSLFA